MIIIELDNESKTTEQQSSTNKSEPGLYQLAPTPVTENAISVNNIIKLILHGIITKLTLVN